MRWIWKLALWLCLATPGMAQTVKVTTGEHDGFTRVVLQSPGLTGWRLQRLPDGYALTLRRPADFDLTGAFAVIPRHRLAALAVMPDRQGLALTLGCACHAIGFDYRPGIVVIDLREGPPPQGSSFELSAAGAEIAPLQPESTRHMRPRPRPATSMWNWTAAALSPPAAPVHLPPRLMPDAALGLRDALLAELADGAARGLVDPVGTMPAAPTPTVAPTARVGLVALPGLAGLTGQDAPESLTAAGALCIPDDRLALPDWGNPDLPATVQLADAAAVLGEFDRPDPAAVSRAVQRHLWLGFGAEAAALVNAFATDAADAPLWRSLAQAVDGDTDPASEFAGMQACDGAAALWAALSAPHLLSAEVNEPAVLRSFSALPPHLRAHLGGPLADRFLAAGDQSTAQALRDAMARADPRGDPLVDAHLALHRNAPQQAEDHARAALDAGGPQTGAALVALTEARLQSRKPMDAAEITALAALLQEQPDDPALARAVLIAQALAGDFNAAFAGIWAADTPLLARTAPDIWALLAETGPDSALIEQAILPAQDMASVPAQAPSEVRRRLAERLTQLGFGAAARAWLGTDADPVALAAADLADGDARSALTRLAGHRGDGAAALRAKALLALGDAASAVGLLAQAADPTAELAARVRARDWGTLRQTGPAAWQAAAATLTPTAAADGQLATGRAILDQSGATRAALTALLDATAQEQPAP